MKPTIAVVTTTSGRSLSQLKASLESVDSQTRYVDAHYVLTDAIVNQDWDKTIQNLCESSGALYCRWPTKIGGPGWEARRLLAAVAPLINEDVTFFLNDDDWYKTNHVESLMQVIEAGFDWAYSFRSIYDEEAAFLFDDICESLGEAHWCWNMPWCNFAETSSLAMRTYCYRQLAHVYDQPGYGIDRTFYAAAKKMYPRFAGSGQHTLCFRLGGNESSVQKGFFEQGNAWMKERYGTRMPWMPELPVEHRDN